MSAIFRTVAALVAGAAAMYYMDPQQGRRRRALARDQMAAGKHDLDNYVDAQRKHVVDRVRGVAARGRSRLAGQPDSDVQLHERIRARLGHLVGAPGAIEVEVYGDYVCLRGHILAPEVAAVIAEIRAMPGVQRIDNELIVHESAVGVPELQGAREDRH